MFHALSRVVTDSVTPLGELSQRCHGFRDKAVTTLPGAVVLQIKRGNTSCIGPLAFASVRPSCWSGGRGKPSSPSSVLASTRTLFKRSLGKLSKILEGVCRPYVFLRFLQVLAILRFTWEVLCESRHLDPNRTVLCCSLAVGCGTSCRLSWTDGLRWVRSTSGTATALCRTCCCTHIGPTELTSH